MNRGLFFTCIVILFLFGFNTGLKAQSDIHFSQYYASPMIVNPANTGLFSGKFRGIVNYRRQWENVGEVYQTIGASGDMLLVSDLFEDDFVGLGVSFAQDQSGVSGFTQTDGALNASYTKILDRYESHFVSIGAQLGYGQRSISVNNLIWDNQWTQRGFDPTLPTGEIFTNFSINFVDLGAGINYFYSNRDETIKGNFGAAAYHLNRPNITIQGAEERLFTKYVFNGGFYWFLDSRSIGFYPNFLWISQGPQNMLNMGIDFKLLLSEATRFTGFRKETALSLGIYHRLNDSFFPMMKLSTGGFTLGISYDLITSNLRAASGGPGGPEFSLMYRIGYKSGAKSQPKNAKFF